MSSKSRNINWIIEVSLLLIYVVLYIIHLYSYGESYFSLLSWLLRWNFRLFGIYYLLFGFAILNGIPIQNIFKKRAYKGVLAAQILLGFAVSAVMAIYIYCNSGYYPSLSVISLFLIFFTFISISITHLFKKREITGRSLYRLVVPIIMFLLFMNLPKHFIDDIRYRNHPEYLEALKDFEREPDPNDTARYNRYLEEEEKLWELKKNKNP